jgi:hypothetical protein
VPGNGVDEDGVGGDLPVGFAVPQPVPVPTPLPHAGAPSVVLIFLESFRADVIGLRDGDREVTPVMNALARRGTHATAYAHMPLTWSSRGSLLQGRVDPTPDGATLVDDFLARGYDVGWFSGQHDGLASEAVRLGIERASRFVDARADVERRTSRSAQPISLQVSWRTVLVHVSELLATRPRGKPLFLYVNLVDTHFPYWHPELDDLLGTGELPREAIRPENRERVWRAYLNAAANVDAAVGRVLAETRERLGPDTLVVITGDHGQSFYEDGLLGHGQSVDDSQSAVPFLVSLPGARLPNPLGMSDLRGLIGDWLDGAQAPAASLARAEIFQHVGVLEQPLVVALRGRARLTEVRPGATRAARSADSLRAVRTWEELAREASKAKRRRP